MKTDLPKKINLSVKNQTRCNTPLLLSFNGKIKLSVFSKKSPFSSSLIFRKSQNFRRLKSSKIKGFYLKNQTVCYNQTGRLNTFGYDLIYRNAHLLKERYEKLLLEDVNIRPHYKKMSKKMLNYRINNWKMNIQEIVEKDY